MGVDVKIKNKQLFKKALKIEDITLGKYKYGYLDDYWRNTGELEEGYNVLYDPDNIGRGMEFQWSNNLKNEINLRINFFSTKYDMEMFYEVIRNILHVWKVKSFEHDGSDCTEADLEELCKKVKKSNLDYIANIDQTNITTIFGAMRPIHLDIERVKSFGENKNEEGFADYLHNLQCPDDYYAVPIVIKLNNTEFFGNYTIIAETDTIFPKKASDPILFKNPSTGEQLKCSFFVVTFVSNVKKRVVGRMAFDEFVEKAGIMNCPKHDMNHVFLKGFSEDEITKLAESASYDPLEKKQ